MNLTEHFRLDEFTRSNIAKISGIPNIPSAAHIENLRLLCVNVLEPVRSLVGAPVIISSGYRSPLLNRHPEIKGARNSQHQTGRAADFSVKGLTTQQLFELIVNSEIQYDQIIQEFDKWVHISYSDKPRRNALVAKRLNNKVKYTIWKK